MSLSKKISTLQKADLADFVKQFYNIKYPAVQTHVYTLDKNTLLLEQSSGSILEQSSGSILEQSSISTSHFPIHTISENEGYLEWYCYSPSELCKFIRHHSIQRYTILPVTIWPVISSTGQRQDKLLIIDNIKRSITLFNPASIISSTNIELIISTTIELLRQPPNLLNYTYIANPEFNLTYDLTNIGIENITEMAHCVLFMQSIESSNTWPCRYKQLEQIDKFNELYNTILYMSNCRFAIYDNEVLHISIIQEKQPKQIDNSETLAELSQEPHENWET
jgi:hypothetical protein